MRIVTPSIENLLNEDSEPSKLDNPPPAYDDALELGAVASEDIQVTIETGTEEVQKTETRTTTSILKNSTVVFSESGIVYDSSETSESYATAANADGSDSALGVAEVSGTSEIDEGKLDVSLSVTPETHDSYL